MKGPSLGPSGDDITWLDQVAPRGRKVSSTRNVKPQTCNLMVSITAQVRVPSSSEVCTVSRAFFALCLFSLATR